jgi:hypothetical protein
MITCRLRGNKNKTITRRLLVEQYERDITRTSAIKSVYKSGADPGFKVRGGALKKIAPSRGRRENCWRISCEKSRFYAKKSYFFRF